MKLVAKFFGREGLENLANAEARGFDGSGGRVSLSATPRGALLA
jgi:hypothetical protein